jgi:hypothetical protein
MSVHRGMLIELCQLSRLVTRTVPDYVGIAQWFRQQRLPPFTALLPSIRDTKQARKAAVPKAWELFSKFRDIRRTSATTMMSFLSTPVLLLDGAHEAIIQDGPVDVHSEALEHSKNAVHAALKIKVTAY